MEECRFALRDKRRLAWGVTLIEVVITVAISMIPISAVLALLIGGQRSWQKGYNSANRQIEIDGQAAAAIFGRVGRKSDYDNCEIYRITKSSTRLICGEMVEFRYWGNKRTNFAGSRQSSEGSGAGPTEHARFYLDEDKKQLKVDYGSYPFGAQRRAARSVVIADNVAEVEFSRVRFNKIGHGSVKMKLTLTDPDDGKTITIMAATLMRN
jgi:hypothetical protein